VLASTPRPVTGRGSADDLAPSHASSGVQRCRRYKARPRPRFEDAERRVSRRIVTSLRMCLPRNTLQFLTGARLGKWRT